jgi:hypothetical protein
LEYSHLIPEQLDVVLELYPELLTHLSVLGERCQVIQGQLAIIKFLFTSQKDDGGELVGLVRGLDGFNDYQIVFCAELDS